MKLITCIRSPVGQKKRRDMIRSTWGKDFVSQGCEVFFILADSSGITKPIVKNDKIYTPGTDTHGDLTNRMIWLFRFLIQNKDFTHVLIMDDDCSVNVELFMNSGWHEHDAWGNNNGGYLSGSAAVYSKDIIKKLNHAMCKDDLAIGSFLRSWKVALCNSNGLVRPWPFKDENGKETSILPEGCAIQHYVRTPEQILNNHKKLNS